MGGGLPFGKDGGLIAEFVGDGGAQGGKEEESGFGFSRIQEVRLTPQRLWPRSEDRFTSPDHHHPRGVWSGDAGKG